MVQESTISPVDYCVARRAWETQKPSRSILLEFWLGLQWISIKLAFHFKFFSCVKYVSANTILIRIQTSFWQWRLWWILNMCWSDKDIKLPTNDSKNPRNVGNVHWLGLLMTRKVKKLYSFSSIKEILSVLPKEDNITTFLCCQDLHEIISLVKDPLTFYLHIHMYSVIWY